MRRKIIIVIAVFQLIAASCSRKLHPENSQRIKENHPEKIYIENPTVSTGKETQKPGDITEKTGSDEKLIPVSEEHLYTRMIKAEQIIVTAMNYLGVPHCMGGTTMKCIDCSGLLVSVFATFGIDLPHSAQAQAGYGAKIASRKELKEGDLVFFTRSYKTRNAITHSGIYIGNNEFIHTSSRSGVSITSLDDPYWSKKFVFGKRILN